MRPRRETALRLLIVVSSIWGGGGCAAAGMAAAGPILSVAGYLLDRGVDRTYAARMPHVWEATLATLNRMQIPVEKAERGEGQGEIRASAGGMTISGELTRATEGMTKISLTVNGGIRPDKETAREILERIAALLQDEPTELASARADVRARAGLALAAPARRSAAMLATAADAAAPPPIRQAATIQKELEALRAELAALREFRAALVREFGGLRSEMAVRLNAMHPPDASEPGKQEDVSVLRVREMVVNEGDLPGSVLVVRMVSAGAEGERDAGSQVRRVDSTPSFSPASAPSRVGSLPGLAHTLRAADGLSAVPSFLQPSTDLVRDGSGQPTPRR